MPCSLSRRQVLQFFMIALPAAAIGFKRVDYFDRELVCVHVYDPARELPPPLLQAAGAAVHRPAGDELFHVGLPELLLCRTRTPMLDRYPFFWPVTEKEVRLLSGSMQVLHQTRAVAGKQDVDEMRGKLPAPNRTGEDQSGSLAVIFTLNDASRAVCAAVVNACRSLGVDELVIFKDPSRPPYLCSHASRQKGFKRPPPIG